MLSFCLKTTTKVAAKKPHTAELSRLLDYVVYNVIRIIMLSMVPKRPKDTQGK